MSTELIVFICVVCNLNANSGAFFGKAFCLVTFQPLSVQELFRYRMSLLITVHLYLELQVRMMSILWELFIFRANNIDANLTSAVKQLTLNGSFCHLIRNVKKKILFLLSNKLLTNLSNVRNINQKSIYAYINHCTMIYRKHFYCQNLFSAVNAYLLIVLYNWIYSFNCRSCWFVTRHFDAMWHVYRYCMNAFKCYLIYLILNETPEYCNLVFLFIWKFLTL